MKVIGLTGGIASGKSTVSSALQDLGAVVIDADEVARLVVEPGQPAWRDIVAVFGEAVLNPDGTLNREALGTRVFGCPGRLQELNRITHPRVIKYFQEELRRIEKEQPEVIVVLDVPLLFESGMDKMCDEVWVVWIDRELEITRLQERDGLSRDEALQRIEAQMPLEEKVQKADRVIDNTGTVEDTFRQVGTIFHESIGKVTNTYEQKKGG